VALKFSQMGCCGVGSYRNQLANRVRLPIWVDQTSKRAPEPTSWRPGRCRISDQSRGAAGRISAGQAGNFGSQPDALGVATRLAARRLREAGIVLEPRLRRAGLSVGQIDQPNARIGVASQIRFLELAAEVLRDPLLGFRLARDGDLRQMGLLYYAAAASQTLGEALDRAVIFNDQALFNIGKEHFSGYRTLDGATIAS
jgi:hypothetical protein